MSHITQLRVWPVDYIAPRRLHIRAARDGLVCNHHPVRKREMRRSMVCSLRGERDSVSRGSQRTLCRKGQCMCICNSNVQNYCFDVWTLSSCIAGWAEFLVGGGRCCRCVVERGQVLDNGVRITYRRQANEVMRSKVSLNDTSSWLRCFCQWRKAICGSSLWSRTGFVLINKHQFHRTQVRILAFTFTPNHSPTF